MASDTTRAQAHALLIQVLQHQPNLLTSDRYPDGESVAKFCSDFIAEYRKSLKQDRQSD